MRTFRKDDGILAFTLIELMVVMSVIAILAGLLFPAVQSARESARRVGCLNNVGQIALALQGYVAQQNVLPGIDLATYTPPKKTFQVATYFHSPIVRILPELEQTPLFNSVNFAFPTVQGAGVNQTAMKTVLAVLLCPSDRQPRVPGYGRVNYRFSLGPSPIWAASTVYPPSLDGPFTVFASYTPSAFPDGLSTTVGMSERLEGDWTKGPFKWGGDYLYVATATYPYIAPDLYDPDHAIRYRAGLSLSLPQESRGGESWLLSGLHFTNYNHCATPNMRIPDCSLSNDSENHLMFRINQQGVFKATSYHPGGVNAALMDGSARFFRDGVDMRVWRAVSTRSGGEVVEFRREVTNKKKTAHPGFRAVVDLASPYDSPSLGLGLRSWGVLGHALEHWPFGWIFLVKRVHGSGNLFRRPRVLSSNDIHPDLGRSAFRISDPDCRGPKSLIDLLHVSYTITHAAPGPSSSMLAHVR